MYVTGVSGDLDENKKCRVLDLADVVENVKGFVGGEKVGWRVMKLSISDLGPPTYSSPTRRLRSFKGNERRTKERKASLAFLEII